MTRSKNISRHEHPSFFEKICFGMGDFGINGAFTFVSSYLLYFYTDSAKLNLNTAGTILLLGRVTDAVISILAGILLDKTNTRSGKSRPFLFVGTLPMFTFMCLLFVMPDISDGAQLLYGCFIYMLFSIFYAFINVPYSTMLSLLTADSKERLSFNIFKNVGGNLGAILVTLSAYFLIRFFGGEDNIGYFKIALLYSSCFIVAVFLCVWNTRERVTPEDKKDTRMGEAIKISFKNRNYLIFILIQFIGMLYMILHNQGTFYYTKYYLEDESLNTVLLSLTPLCCIICAFVLPKIKKWIGLRHLLFCGHMLVAISLLGTFLVSKNASACLIFAVFTSTGWSMATGMIFVILSLLIDQAERNNGLRPQGVMSSWMTFFMKMGTAAAGYLGSWILRWGGYVADKVPSLQAMQAIKANFIYVPVILSFAMALLSLRCYFGEEK